MTSPRSSLAPYAASMRDPDPQGAQRAAKQLWHEKGIAVIFVDEIHGLERDMVMAIANKNYGKRRS